MKQSARWSWTTLGELSEHPQYGWTTKANSAGNGLRLLRTTDIASGDLDWAGVPFCDVQPEDPERYLLRDGDLVISRAGSVGYSLLIVDPPPAVFASYLIRFRLRSGIIPRFVAWFLKSPQYWSQIRSLASGIALQNINAKKLQGIAVPVPSVADQEAIVASIEEQLANIDAGVEWVSSGKRKLAVWRNGVLEEAFGHRPTRPLGEIADVVRGVTYKKDEARESASPGYVSLLRATNIGRALELTKVLYVPSGRVAANQLLRAGDIVCASSSGSLSVVGKAAPLTSDWHGTFGAFCTVVRPGDAVNPRYLALFMESGRYRRRMSNLAAGVNINNLRRSHFLEAPIPWAERDEQDRIVAWLESATSVADKVEMSLRQSARWAHQLKASALASAFRDPQVS